MTRASAAAPEVAVVSSAPPAARLERSEYAVDAPMLARRLLGQRLVRVLDDGRRLSGVIVETEAYIGAEDRASHAFGLRRTPRNKSMYAQPGTAYVYFTYGMHFMFNVVCGRVEEPVAVLIRALAPEEGADSMMRRRGRARRAGAPPLRARDLCSGPGKLCQALAIDRSLDGVDLCVNGSIYIERLRDRPYGPARLANSARIGVGITGRWAEAALRWHVKNDPHVSRR